MTAAAGSKGSFRWPTSGVGICHPLAEGRNGRERADEFVRFAEAALAGTPYDDAKDAFEVSQHQAETRKSMLEEMGLVYVPYASNQVIVTPVGRQLYELLSRGDYETNRSSRARINAVIAWALSNSQINRPQSRGSPSPTPEQWQTCDIRPYAAGWKAILELDGWLSIDEFFGVLWHVHRVDEFALALDTIRAARARRARLIDPERFARGGDLMNPRIYWISHLSSGSTILTLQPGHDRLVFAPGGREIAETVLRFAGGCGAAGDAASFHARPYTSVEQYFEDVAGRACPEFLFSGSMRVEQVNQQPITVLQGYSTEMRGSEIRLEGGPELCSIPLNSPCYHSSVPDRLLRLAVKEESADYKVILRFERGRPFTGKF